MSGWRTAAAIVTSATLFAVPVSADASLRVALPDVTAAGRRIVLTNGGWRRRWLPPGARLAVGPTRPSSDAVTVDRGDVTADPGR